MRRNLATARRSLAIVVNLVVGVMSLVAWLFMTSFAGEASVLEAGGLGNLRFFTVQSNLLNGAVALAMVALLVRGREKTQVVRTVKLVAASAVGLTFVTVMTFLGPLYGYALMLHGANLWFHLLLPLLTALSFVFLEEGPQLARRAPLWALLPPGVYAAGYVANIALNGVGEWPNANDFYSFLAWGPAVGALIAVMLMAVAFIVALGLRAAANARAARR